MSSFAGNGGREGHKPGTGKHDRTMKGGDAGKGSERGRFQRNQGLVNKIMARQRCCEVASIDFKLNTLFPWSNKGSVAFT